MTGDESLITRIAMWSGPRNISTAMMRSWEARGDCAVCDEPLYAFYLKQTGADHPMAEEIISKCETDYSSVVSDLLGPVPDNKLIFYQKHMAHHLLPGFDTGWVSKMKNCFLIRQPEEMLTSLIMVIPNPSLEETGLPQQEMLLQMVDDLQGQVLPILDSRDVLNNPRVMLKLLCQATGVCFTESMLHWKPGRRDSDGIWAKHWYASVERSTGFSPYKPKNENVPRRLLPLLRECEKIYERLYSKRLIPGKNTSAGVTD